MTTHQDITGRHCAKLIGPEELALLLEPLNDDPGRCHDRGQEPPKEVSSERQDRNTPRAK